MIFEPEPKRARLLELKTHSCSFLWMLLIIVLFLQVGCSTSPTPTNNPTITSTPTNTPLPTLIVENVGQLEVPMVLVPAGSFQMGSGDGDFDERPIHTVLLDTFFMDQYEVTNEQYLTCVDSGSCDERNTSELRVPGFAQYPVRIVSWFDAQTFCEWRGARLPTEAEWEKAARGGLDGAAYPWGDEPPVCDLGAFNGAQFGDCEGELVPVGSFAPNGYGLYDMAGNVWEWVLDWYGEGYYGTLADGAENPAGPESGIFRVLRGGSGVLIGDVMRSAGRDFLFPGNTNTGGGFRCARSP